MKLTNIFDVWILGDDFVRKTFPELQELRRKAKGNPDVVQLYLYDFYMVHPCHQVASIGVKSVMACMLNVLTDTLMT